MFSRPDIAKLLLVALLLVLSVSQAQAARAIVNVQQADDEIADRRDLRAVFTLRKRQWRSGQRIKVYVLSDKDPLHEAFVKQKLHLFPYQLRQIWNRLVFSGTGVAPVELASEAEVLQAVANEPDSIGYVSEGELPEGVKEVPLPEESLEPGAQQ